MKKAIITGITGQDGSYLAELLLEKGYEVHGVMRRASSFNTKRIDHLYQDPHVANRTLFLHFGDLADANTIRKLIYQVKPDEIYNLGAQSHVKVSFDMPEYTANVTGIGPLRIIEAVKDFREETGQLVRVYQASSSEMFGSSLPPQCETTIFHPRSPYGAAKAFAFYAVQNYREAYKLFAVNGILFNHESPRRGGTFVTKKITTAVARIKDGTEKKLYLGNLAARRDWGYAPEYVEAMWLMMQQEKPEDYVIGTGESHSVEEFVAAAFKHAGFDDWHPYVEVDPGYYRPADVETLIADPRKAEQQLGWKARTRFNDLVRIMVESDLKEYGSSK